MPSNVSDLSDHHSRKFIVRYLSGEMSHFVFEQIPRRNFHTLWNSAHLAVSGIGKMDIPRSPSPNAQGVVLKEQATPPRPSAVANPSRSWTTRSQWMLADTDDNTADDEMCRLSRAPLCLAWDARSSPDSCEFDNSPGPLSTGSVTPVKGLSPTHREKRSRSVASLDDDASKGTDWFGALEKLLDLFQRRRYAESRRYMATHSQLLRVSRQKELPIVRRPVVYKSTIVLSILLQFGWFDDCDSSYLYDSLSILCKHSSAPSVVLFLYHSSTAQRFVILGVSPLRVRLDLLVRETLDPVIKERRPGWHACLSRKHIVESSINVLDDWIRGFNDGKLLLVI